MSLLGFIAIGYSIILCCFHFDIISYLKYTKQDSTIYEDNYVDGRDVAITFPKEKKKSDIYFFRIYGNDIFRSERWWCYE